MPNSKTQSVKTEQSNNEKVEGSVVPSTGIVVPMSLTHNLRSLGSITWCEEVV